MRENNYNALNSVHFFLIVISQLLDQDQSLVSGPPTVCLIHIAHK